METWILIIILTTSRGFGVQTVFTSSTEFNSKETCIVARDDIKKVTKAVACYKK